MRQKITTIATLLVAAAAANAQNNRVHNGEYWVDIPTFSEGDEFTHLPSHFTLNGTMRDFRERHVIGGHPDFEIDAPGGNGHYQGIVADELDADGKPVFQSSGYKVSAQATDADGNPIISNRSHVAAMPGDVEGDIATETGGIVTDAESFSQWFRNTPGVNAAAAFPITLVRQPGTDLYVFDDKLATHFVNTSGFFPINDRLYGNSLGNNKNFHFTYELATEFTYHEGAGQTFTFEGDDDLWVFVDGKVAVDIGGIHVAVRQTINMDRLEWLEDGQTYNLNIFFAERHRTQSNYRIETNLQLRLKSLLMPQSDALWD